MKTRYLVIIFVALVICSCQENRPGPAMGWTAQGAVDRFCGMYRMVSNSWAGPVDADLTGDGIVAGSHFEELLSGKWLGVQEPLFHIQPVLKLDKPQQFTLGAFGGDYVEGWEESLSAYSILSIYCYYTVDVNGAIRVVVDEDRMLQEQLSHYNGEIPGVRHCRFDNIEVSLEGDIIALSGDTSYYNYFTGNEISGRETFFYKCVSSKEKVE